jgi:hypothetical protein
VRAANPGDDATEAVIESYELAFRMQAELPGLLDLSKEKQSTLTAYGIGAEETDTFGRQCLSARHLAAAGVRFIEIGLGGWDHHRNLREELPARCRAIDKPIAGLLADLAASGLLAETLVVWGGEFGRTPYAQARRRPRPQQPRLHDLDGRRRREGRLLVRRDRRERHRGRRGPMSIHDWHATILHLLGLDHER